jgi:tyrosinase
MPETRLEAIRRILDAATDQGSPGNPVHGGLRRFWNLARDEFVNAVVYGQQVIVVGRPEDSALIKSLKGVAPFDGSQFPRMPIGRPSVSDTDIAFIAQWIRDGCPDSDSEARDKK